MGSLPSHPHPDAPQNASPRSTGAFPPRFALGQRVAVSILGSLFPSSIGVVDQVVPVAIGFACQVRWEDARRGAPFWIHEDWLLPA